MTASFTDAAHSRTCTGTDDDLDPWRGRHGDPMRTCRVCRRVSSVVTGGQLVERPRPAQETEAGAEVSTTRAGALGALAFHASEQTYRSSQAWPRHKHRARQQRAQRLRMARERRKQRRATGRGTTNRKDTTR